MAFAEHPGLIERIDYVIDSIEFIRAELSHPATDKSTGLAVPKVPVAVAQRLKYSVDQFRLFLWAYLDSWAQGSTNPASRLQRIRMAAAADMLGLLAQEFSSEGVPTGSEAFRLGEQLRAMASILVDVRGQEPS